MHLPLVRARHPRPDRPVVKVRYVELPWEWVQPPQEDSVHEIYLVEPPHLLAEVIWLDEEALDEEVRDPDPVVRREVENNPDEGWEDVPVAVENNPDEVWDEEVQEVEEAVVVEHHLPRTKTTRATPRHREDDLEA